jgi:site-specific DNA-methyltransferase (adenine-specific)
MWKRMKNKIYYGDNLQIIRKYIQSDSVDLIYLDPPFNSKKQYNVIYKEPSGATSKAQTLAFDDTWSWTEETQRTYEELITRPDIKPDIVSAIKAFHDMFGTSDLMAYLVMMTIRLIELHRVLKSTGSIYLHCDPTASHYLKIIMDQIFDIENFQNEIVWYYGARATVRKTGFPQKHDIILSYSKTNKHFYEPLYLGKYKDPDLKRYNKTDEFGKKYALIKRIRSSTNEVYYGKTYPKAEGAPMTDVWDIPTMASTSSERTGYPTQKPLALLERIIKSSCPPNGTVLDPFCGCASTLIETQKLNSTELNVNRTWIGIDITYLSVVLLKHRLNQEFPGIQQEYEIIGEPVSLLEATKLAEQNKHQFAIWAITKICGKPNIRKSGDQGIDGYYDFIDNNTAKRGIIQVKGGHLTLSSIRDFCHTVKREKADIGIFLTLTAPSKQMIQEANGEGFYTDTLLNQYKKISIITVDDLLNNHYTIPPAKRM